MKLKNEIFASALDWLIAHQKVDGQKSLAHVLGISENTISRIMTGKVEPSDDTLRKLSEKFGFNMSWLRGTDPNHMFPEDIPFSNQQHVDQSSLINATIAAKDETISSLKRELAAKDETIQTKNERIADLEKLAEERLHRIAELRRVIDANNMMDYPFPVGTADPKDKKEHMRV